MKKIILYCLIFATHGIILSNQWKTVYAHGIVDGPQQLHRFDEAIATTSKRALSFPDAQPAKGFGLNYGIAKITQLFGKHINRAHMHMGQGGDVKSLKNFIKIITSQQDSLILYGCSRGSATIINYMGQYNIPTVKALVLDSCPANMAEAIQPILIKMGLNPNRAISIFTTLFPAYPKNAITPLQSIKTIKNKQLPILLIHSLDDTVVPYQHSLMLYQEFRNQGFINVHLITIPKGKHSFLLQNKAANPLYLKAVHSFYKKYDLPHHEKWATINIADYDIDHQIVTKKIQAYKRFIQKHSS